MTQETEITHKTREIHRQQLLKYHFTDDELHIIASQMAEAQESIDRANDELTSIKNQFKAKIAEHEAVRSGSASKYRTGYEYRSYDVTDIHDFDASTVTTIRDDTSEIVATRDMMGDERQMELEFRVKEEETP